MKLRAYRCPDCGHELVVEHDDNPLYCGLCHIRFRRNVQLIEDPGAGDVSHETIRPSGLITPEEWSE